ncbi:MAG: KpsF/GutQ family sugar-phosphate isomerase [Bacteroidetes bacterium]|nr:KpsF/GutQ family sugar-phosphate isomerase [Bacteroidota bacterium]MBP6413294.1 KpsF/GutQ family sugar-phosphate isomerase [Bacteroidia bacterium]
MDFVKSVELIYHSKGRVIITGIGKSAIIAQKIVATLNSTGTPSSFMHAADAIHGDLGTISNEDVIICISKSGNTPEIKVLVPLLKQGGNKLIALVGNTDSFLAQQADYVLNCYVEKEACPNNLAPTSSTTAQLALGDALAVCLLDCRDFSSSDFAKFHPGGALGKKLYLKVLDISSQNAKPQIESTASIKSVIVEISSNRLGACAVIENGELVGIITDGDLRRMLEKTDSFQQLKAADIMNTNPKKIDENELAITALQLLQNNNISQLLVTSGKKYSGIIHLHDLLKEGII